MALNKAAKIIPSKHESFSFSMNSNSLFIYQENIGDFQRMQVASVCFPFLDSTGIQPTREIAEGIIGVLASRS